MDAVTTRAQEFARDGYLVLPGFKAPAEIGALRARASGIIDAFAPDSGAGTFSTRDESTKSDEYFLTSGNVVRCFFEEEAFDASGKLCVPKEQSINKIGHAMHELDPVFEQFSTGIALQQLALDLGVTDPRVYQSMYIFKQPHIGGEVRWHQDATYFATDPVSVITLWFALERADRENGCLWVQPGGHRTPLREQFVVGNGRGTLKQIDATPWPTIDEAVPVEVEAGALVVLHGRLPHYSAPNRSSSSRHAYTLHFVDGRTTYDARNWIQRDASFPAKGFV